MSNTGPIIADRLKSFIARAERLIEERKAIQADITDIFLEAKGVGHDVKTIRKVIALRAMDPADRLEQECLLDTYRKLRCTVADAVAMSDPREGR